MDTHGPLSAFGNGGGIIFLARRALAVIHVCDFCRRAAERVEDIAGGVDSVSSFFASLQDAMRDGDLATYCAALVCCSMGPSAILRGFAKAPFTRTRTREAEGDPISRRARRSALLHHPTTTRRRRRPG